jgi:hypothetical protein
MAAVEASRRHAELLPKFDVSCTQTAGGSDNYLLRMTLIGPSGLDGLDEVVPRICNEKWRDRTGGQVRATRTIQEMASVIWGPLRFRPHVDGSADEIGRIARFGPLDLGDRNWLL